MVGVIKQDNASNSYTAEINLFTSFLVIKTQTCAGQNNLKVPKEVRQNFLLSKHCKSFIPIL